MVTDGQVRLLMRRIQTEKSLAVAAAKSGMSEKTARKYRDSGKLPGEVRPSHTWRTRPDPFEWVWEEVRRHLEREPGLEARTLFEALQRQYPGRFADGQVRTLQRRVKTWRAVEGPGREVYFPQVHEPGLLCESDFTHMTSLGVTLHGRPFLHLIYHFVLPYSNWETGTICFSESFESLSDGLQNALWELGGVVAEHRTDRLTAAVHKMDHPEEFTQRYEALLRHYGLGGRKIQAGQAHENGDVEQSHHRFKRGVDQALLLRGSRDFEDREAYGTFLRDLLARRNRGRKARFVEEIRSLRPLPRQRLDAGKRLLVRVGPSSTIRVQHNVYSVHSRLRGERVEVRLSAESLEIWYAQRRVDAMPRLRGERKHQIDYRHIIEWLVKKPGAFENYRYRDDLYPTSRFRVASDALKRGRGLRGTREYLGILQLAARESEVGVDDALRHLIDRGESISVAAVAGILACDHPPARPTAVTIADVNLSSYDALLGGASCR
jgi:hypothetical protein